VWPEQGFGDQIMLARFVSVLRERDCEVIFVCRAALHKLLADNLDALVLPATGNIEFPEPDVWLWCGSLLAASEQTLETLSGKPYLVPAAPRRGSHRIGIATHGSSTHPNDAHRSLPAAIADRLFAIPGAMSLLPEHTGAADFAETANIIAGLDLVISVDTSIAHLAGALGKPVWIILPDYQTDWRWLRGRDDSPWYASARLFRQAVPGDWSIPIERILAEICDY
jgi:hypothetical protein